MKLRLFALKDTSGKELPGQFFSAKPDAKRVRDRLNQEAGRTEYTIGPGPDHHRLNDGRRK